MMLYLEGMFTQRMLLRSCILKVSSRVIRWMVWRRKRTGICSLPTERCALNDVEEYEKDLSWNGCRAWNQPAWPCDRVC